MSTDKTLADVRNLIVCDTQFGWTGSTTLQLQQMLALQERGWLAEGEENDEFDLTDAGREVVARALQSAVQPTLADVQPGGRVRLGDQAERARFEAWAESRKHTLTRWGDSPGDVKPLFVSEVAGNYISPAAQAAWEAWQHLSAQPSPGGQGDASHYWPEVDRILVDAYVAGSEGDEFDMIAARTTIHAALAAPPAKAVDLAMVERAMLAHVGKHATRYVLDDLRALIDSQAVGK